MDLLFVESGQLTCFPDPSQIFIPVEPAVHVQCTPGTEYVRSSEDNTISPLRRDTPMDLHGEAWTARGELTHPENPVGSGAIAESGGTSKGVADPCMDPQFQFHRSHRTFAGFSDSPTMVTLTMIAPKGEADVAIGQPVDALGRFVWILESW